MLSENIKFYKKYCTYLLERSVAKYKSFDRIAFFFMYALKDTLPIRCHDSSSIIRSAYIVENSNFLPCFHCNESYYHLVNIDTRIVVVLLDVKEKNRIGNTYARSIPFTASRELVRMINSATGVKS